MGKTSGKDPQWLINLTMPVEVLVSNLTHVLGSPQEINTLNASNVDFTQIVAISQSSHTAEEVSTVGLVDQASNKSSSGPTTSTNSRASIP